MTGPDRAASGRRETGSSPAPSRRFRGSARGKPRRRLRHRRLPRPLSARLAYPRDHCPQRARCAACSLNVSFAFMSSADDRRENSKLQTAQQLQPSAPPEGREIGDRYFSVPSPAHGHGRGRRRRWNTHRRWRACGGAPPARRLWDQPRPHTHRNCALATSPASRAADFHPPLRSRRRAVDDLAADDRQVGADVRDLVLGAGEVVAIRHDQIGKLTDRDPALLAFFVREPGDVLCPHP